MEDLNFFLCDCSSGNGGSQEAHCHVIRLLSSEYCLLLCSSCSFLSSNPRCWQGVGSRDLSFIKIKSDGLHQMINPIKKLNLLGGCRTCEAPFLQAFLHPCINLWIIMKFRESLLIIHMFPHKKDCYTVRSPLRLPATNQTSSLQLRGGDVAFFTTKTKRRAKYERHPLSPIRGISCLSLFLHGLSIVGFNIMIPPIIDSFCACPPSNVSLCESRTSSAPVCLK